MTYSLFDLAQDISERTPDGIKNVANKAANFACGLYQEYPAFFVGSIPNPLLRGGAWLTMELLCQPRNMTPPMPSPASFTGGQCRCIYYSIAYRIYFPDGYSVGGNAELFGEILGARVNFGGSVPPAFANYEILCRGNLSTGCLDVPTWFKVGDGRNVPAGAELRILSVARLDGLPDGCGDLPPKYPDVDPPPEKLKGDTDLVIRPEFAPRIPIIFVSPKFEFPLHLKIGDFNVKFDAGGVRVDLGGDSSQDLDEIIRRLDRIEADTADALSNLNDLTQDTRDFNQDFIDEVNKRNNKNPDADDLEKDPPDDEKEKDNIEYLYGVNLQLLTIPVNAKMQYGVDAPNLYYAGWFEFKRGNFVFPRQPISFINNFYKAPEGANGFAYTLAVGYEGQSEVIRSTPREVV